MREPDYLTADGRGVLFQGDCLDSLKFLPDNSLDAIVTDPPAGIRFMGKSWDANRGGRDAWIAWARERAAECLRIAKPGAHALVWALPRTSHWTATAWEDAGWEVRDRVSHLFGQGFPKSLDVSKAIDDAAGAEREVVGVKVNTYDGATRDPAKHGNPADQSNIGEWGLKQTPHGMPLTAPATADAAQWDGWGTALKPACEDWWLLRKPLSEANVAANVLKWGTGAINIDACRIPGEKPAMIPITSDERQNPILQTKSATGTGEMTSVGRWPANLMHDGSDEVLAEFPDVQPSKGQYVRKTGDSQFLGEMGDGKTNAPDGLNDAGSAARFFYCSKASKKDRGNRKAKGKTLFGEIDEGVDNKHPTVKPLELMEWLCMLITPPGGKIIDPFGGSGSTGKAALALGFSIILCEAEAEYCKTIAGRLNMEPNQ